VLSKVRTARGLVCRKKWGRPILLIRDKPILSSERMFHKGYGHNGLVVIRKIVVVSHKGAWR
jgi:hypothetical protein